MEAMLVLPQGLQPLKVPDLLAATCAIGQCSCNSSNSQMAFFEDRTVISYFDIIHAKDFLTHAKIADRLLGHFTAQYLDRQMYYLARSRSRCQKDMLTCIIDSYDKAKCSVPKWVRAPKKSVYEGLKRALTWKQNVKPKT